MFLHHLSDHARGTLLAVIANLIWGFAALYWMQTAPADSVDLLAHRAAWSVLVLAILLRFEGGLGAALTLMRDGRTLAIMATCAALCAANWGIFLWAISNGEASNASLGYFLLPLVNVVIGLTAFREELDSSKLLAVSCAAIAMGLLIVSQRGLPDSPLSGRRRALCIKRSKMASARVLSPMLVYHWSVGNWLIISVEVCPCRSSIISIKSLRWAGFSVHVPPEYALLYSGQ